MSHSPEVVIFFTVNDTLMAAVYSCRGIHTVGVSFLRSLMFGVLFLDASPPTVDDELDGRGL